MRPSPLSLKAVPYTAEQMCPEESVATKSGASELNFTKTCCEDNCGALGDTFPLIIGKERSMIDLE